MSKRPCPFEDNCAPQSKVHVSSEDMNRQSEDYRKELQNKTLAMLFKGVNNIPTMSPQPPGSVTTACPSCKGPPNFISRCWFCELSLCQKCERMCTYCFEKFCSQCSVPIYKYGTNFTCLTCYK